MRSLSAGIILLALCALSLGACGGTPEVLPRVGDDNRGIGPFTPLSEGAQAPKWLLDGLDKERPTQLSVRNLMGDVVVRPSADDAIRIELLAVDGQLPAIAELRSYNDAQHLFVLDTESAINDQRPEQPTSDHEGKIHRLGLILPRVDVAIWLPKRVILTIDACASLDLNADADVRVRAGSKVQVSGGNGTLMVWAPELWATSNSYDIFADVTSLANLSGTDGAKAIRGKGDVVISRGSGLLDINVAGTVLTQTLVSGGYPRTNLRDFAHRDGFTPIGPEISVFGTRGIASERARTGSRVTGKSVRILLDASSRLEIDVNVTRGEARLRLADPSIITLHEWTSSTARLTIGNPTGELVVNAIELAEILVEE